MDIQKSRSRRKSEIQDMIRDGVGKCPLCVHMCEYYCTPDVVNRNLCDACNANYDKHLCMSRCRKSLCSDCDIANVITGRGNGGRVPFDLGRSRTDNCCTSCGRSDCPNQLH